MLSLAKCRVFEHHSSEWPELNYRAFRVECSHDNETESIIFMASSINDKAQWMADFSQVIKMSGCREWSRDCHVMFCLSLYPQCVENEKQNKILQSQR